MEFQVLNAAVVVLADAHNPSILHPNFLVTEKIVPSSWELAEAPLCTPPISLVKFGNGIVFTVETSKLQVLQNDPPADLEKIQIAELVNKYITTLPHVRYTAVGVNFTAFVAREGAPNFLVDRFLKNGTWNDGKLAPSTIGLRLVYPAEPGDLRISVDAGTVQPAGASDRQDGIIVTANFHLDLEGTNYLENAKEGIFHFPTRCKQFVKFTNRVLDTLE